MPQEKNYFDENFRKRFKVKPPQGVDLKSVYVQEYYQDYDGKLWKREIDEFKSCIRFYGNGNVNIFIVPGDYTGDLDPKISGYRGVSYTEKGDFFIGVISPINPWYKMGKKTNKIKVVADTLFVHSYNKAIRKFEKSKHIYLRKPLLEKNLQYQADW
ncbi:hypothetical protein L0P88_09350 [Muricauda sp. SCSIO 64092]|uniref:hypothetical protein n=1 Tax=Allomuricauda sp. SCSIO 64092 TaxID=2908842 RepID=UPI001FF61931|nr:hypothetical protein [Muricauda sp. SCSIO 64092]UOY08741.1 hypothetical protein L0P88_09350 [Muricauda sp. SCSIO 64092]